MQELTHGALFSPQLPPDASFPLNSYYTKISSKADEGSLSAEL